LILAARLLARPNLEGLPPVPEESARELAARSGLAARPEGERALSNVLAAVDATEPNEWADEYGRLFEGASSCPPNETAYVRRDKGAILADICGFYRAFGFELAPSAGEKADHIVAELEFVALLIVMLARSREEGDPEAEAVTRTALGAFLHDHLDEWWELFCERLEEAASIDLYRAVAGFSREVLESLIDIHGLPRATRAEIGAPDQGSGTPYECGLADGNCPPSELPASRLRRTPRGAGEPSP
jgi:TorA maturation chaperone TorD